MTGAIGQVIEGRFELLAALGSGGMGTVWRARDLALQRDVALKEVRDPGGGDDHDVLARVRREAQALARLNHPNVVSIHHLIDIQPHPWLVMELIQGQSLEALIIARGPAPERETARVGLDICRALRAAHRAGLHHRDVKPGNVLLRPDGSAVLTDFGIAVFAEDTRITATGQVIGSPEFMAPERLRGAPDLPASDFYSLGMLMLVTIEGRNPLRRSSPLATLAAVLDGPPVVPAAAGALAPLLEALLRSDPMARPSAEQVEDFLVALVAADGATTAAATIPPLAGATPAGAFDPSSRTPQAAAQPAPVGSSRVTGDDWPQPSPPSSGFRRGRLLLVAAVCLALLIGGIFGGRALVDNPADDRQATGSTSAASPTAGSATAPATAASTAPAATSAGTGSGSPQPSQPSPVSTPAPAPAAPTVTVTRQAPAPDQPTAAQTASPDGSAISTPPVGSWIAQLASVPMSASAATREARLRQARRAFPGATMFASSTYGSFRSGYWVIWSGTYSDGNSALAACRSAGLRSSNACLGRLVSTSASDRRYVCTRPDTNVCRKD